MSDTRSTPSDETDATDRNGMDTDFRSDAGGRSAVTAETALPGPRGLPLVGNTLSFVRDPIGFFDGIREYGDLAYYEAFGRDFVVISDPELVETVLVSRSDEFWRGEFEAQLGEALGIEGLFFAEGDRWQRQRLLLQSSFTPARIQSYADDMVAESVRLVESWGDGEVVDLTEELSTLTLRALTRSLFDIELTGQRARHVRRWVEAMGAYIETDSLGVRAMLPVGPEPSRTRVRSGDGRRRNTRRSARRTASPIGGG